MGGTGRKDSGFGSFAFGKLKSKIEKGELNGDELKHRIEDRSFPNESDDLISSLHLRLLSSTGVSVGVSLQIERSQLPIERSQLRNLNPLLSYKFYLKLLYICYHLFK
ncbi:hypothetical protein Bca52824_041078 [Brassica carinata]|uniref:Uncharacterized protein n=1 Tax=Brassica carinata TaxID=52824 RepID=A0A8X7RSH8_BRACI|nr:hypothetical protein Bca52824_041078 [Brassica carinata]